MRYAWIHEHRDSYPVAVMCRVLQVSASGYYRSLRAEPGPRAHRSARIHDAVSAVFESSNEVDGSAKIARTLETDPDLETACRNTVAKAMREMGLKSRVSKKFRPSTTQADPSKTPAPNLLKQKFTATAANQKWVADITYLPTAMGWVYLAVVLDLFSRKVVGWDISESLATPLVSSALRQAVESRSPKAGELLHHSDRGSPIHQRRLPVDPSHLGDHLLDEPHRVLLRQRGHGAILLVAETRMDEIRIVRRSPRRKAQRLSLHRVVLQHRTNSSVARLSDARPV